MVDEFHAVAAGGDEQVVEDLVVARAELRVVGLLPEAHPVPGIKAEDVVADHAPAHAGEVRPGALACTVVEVVRVDEEVVARALAALARARIGVAARVVERNADLLAGGGRVGVDLEVARDVAVGLIEADDVPVAAVAQVDAVAVARFRAVGDVAFPYGPVGLSRR